MPVDELNDKWACEPCIRGHRSTKCEHFLRYMVRVRRPGRPSDPGCPHYGIPCHCAGKERVIMVRVPMVDGCRCTRADLQNYQRHHSKANRQIYRSPHSEARARAMQRMALSNRNQFTPIEPTRQQIQYPESAPAPAQSMPTDGVFGQYQHFGQNQHGPMPSEQWQVPMPNAQHAMPNQQYGHHGLDYESYQPGPLHQQQYSVAAATSQLQEIDLNPDTQLSSHSMGGSVPQQPPPYHAWGEPGFDFNDTPFNAAEPASHMLNMNQSVVLANGVSPDSSVMPENCCRDPSTLERSSEESNERSLLSAQQQDQLLNDAIASSMATLEHDEAKTDKIDDSAENVLQSMINSAPQTTMYSLPPNYATVDNPVTSSGYNQLQASESLRPDQLPYFAGSGIVGSTANAADSLEGAPRRFECPCGPGCECLMCVAHPYNRTTRRWVGDMYSMMDEDLGSQMNQAESPTLPTMGDSTDSAGIELTNGLNSETQAQPKDSPWYSFYFQF